MRDTGLPSENDARKRQNELAAERQRRARMRKKRALGATSNDDTIPLNNDESSFGRFMSSFDKIANSIVSSGVYPSTMIVGAKINKAPSREMFNNRLDFLIKTHQLKMEAAKILISCPDEAVRKEGVELLKVLMRTIPSFDDVLDSFDDEEDEVENEL